MGEEEEGKKFHIADGIWDLAGGGDVIWVPLFGPFWSGHVSGLGQQKPSGFTVDSKAPEDWVWRPC